MRKRDRTRERERRREGVREREGERESGRKSDRGRNKMRILFEEMSACALEPASLFHYAAHTMQGLALNHNSDIYNNSDERTSC